MLGYGVERTRNATTPPASVSMASTSSVGSVWVSCAVSRVTSSSCARSVADFGDHGLQITSVVSSPDVLISGGILFYVLPNTLLGSAISFCPNQLGLIKRSKYDCILRVSISPNWFGLPVLLHTVVLAFDHRAIDTSPDTHNICTSLQSAILNYPISLLN